jgi:hypothetical protein
MDFPRILSGELLYAIAMTQRYAHLSPEHTKAAVEALGKTLRGEGKKDATTA